jgi:sugar phosphate isomerase/epimerase
MVTIKRVKAGNKKVIPKLTLNFIFFQNGSPYFISFLSMKKTVCNYHSCLFIPIAFTMCLAWIPFQAITARQDEGIEMPSRVKTGLNAFSFNEPLSTGRMDLDGLLEYAARAGFDAVDITAYYFPGYPEVPSDEYLYHIKSKAFQLGLEISGTGVRNDFTHPDPEVRKEGVALVKAWILAAEKLGAPVIRIFAGQSDTEGYSRELVLDWLVEDVKECVKFGKSHGVMIGIQNHHDFIQTAEQAIEIIERVNSEWIGLILDTGSFWTGDSYAQIKMCIPYTLNWQVKVLTYMDGVAEEIDLVRLMGLIKDSGYRGYLPLETLDPGDPVPQAEALLAGIRAAIEKVYGGHD